MTSEEPAKKLSSEKIDDPQTLFENWAFAIDKHHWGTLGVSLRTFQKAKQRYLAWARDRPPIYNFYGGYIFYSSGPLREFLQIGSINDANDQIEVHFGVVAMPESRRGVWATQAQLLEWLKSGSRPQQLVEIFRGEGKSGQMGWQLPARNREAVESNGNSNVLDSGLSA
jgi:hypothetical protein